MISHSAGKEEAKKATMEDKDHTDNADNEKCGTGGMASRPIPNDPIAMPPVPIVTHGPVSTEVSNLNHQSLDELNEMMENTNTNSSETNNHGAAVVEMAVDNANIEIERVSAFAPIVNVLNPADINDNLHLHSHASVHVQHVHDHDQLVQVVDPVTTPVPMPVPLPIPVTVPAPVIDAGVPMVENTSVSDFHPSVHENHHNQNQNHDQMIHQSYEMVQVQAIEEAANHHDHRTVNIDVNSDTGNNMHINVNSQQGNEMEVQGHKEDEHINEVEQVILGTLEAVADGGMDSLEILNNTPLAATTEEFDKKYPAEIELMPASDAPIEIPNTNDILFGRGGLTNHHPGNKVYRAVIASHKPDYQNAAKIVKPRVARRIVHAIRHSQTGARFLKKETSDGMWRDVGDKIASEKTSQALREKSAEEKKAHAKANTNTDNVTAGYMPPLSTNESTFYMNQSPQEGAMDPTLVATGIQEGTLVEIASHGQEIQHPVVAYPAEGGTFGSVNADGHITVTEQDILCGRGGATNHHQGNKRFRDVVALHRPDYVAATKIRKPDVARKIVRAIRLASPPGRFLKKRDDGKWVDIGDKKAAEKASQALREKGPDARKAAKTSSNAVAAAAAVVAVSIDPNQATEVHHYPSFPDVGTEAQGIAHTPFNLNVGTTPVQVNILKPESESKNDLLPDLTKRDAGDAELGIESPDMKRLKCGESEPEEYHV